MTRPLHTQIEESERFRAPATRRDFLGIAAAWSAVVAFVMAMLGAMRLPMPSVFPESNSRVKLGRPAQFIAGSMTYFARHRLWLFREEKGFHAISSVCTHLGCITERGADGAFHCPCHGSVFDAEGKVKGGPAPKGLVWVELSVSPEGWLVADTLKEVKANTVFNV
ncbi:MAG: ubiquinol-cytochrome c reductase iron-sulfur subunit [Planctomycetota bacterium]